MATRPEWTNEDSLAAQREGWNVWNASDEYGCRIERYDVPEDVTLPDGSHPPMLESDWEAHRLVREGIARGSALHIKALAMVGDEERDTILNPEG